MVRVGIQSAQSYRPGMPELRRAGLLPGKSGELAWESGDGFATSIDFEGQILSAVGSSWGTAAGRSLNEGPQLENLNAVR